MSVRHGEKRIGQSHIEGQISWSAENPNADSLMKPKATLNHSSQLFSNFFRNIIRGYGKWSEIGEL